MSTPAPGTAPDDPSAVAGYLLAAYADRIDAGDFAAVGELFREGELCAGDGTVLAAGASAVAAFYGSIVMLHDGIPATTHLVSNIAITAADPTRISVNSRYQVLQGLDDFPLQTLIVGRYADELHRDSTGSWSFARRTFGVDLVGDLHRHLRMEL